MIENKVPGKSEQPLSVSVAEEDDGAPALVADDDDGAGQSLSIEIPQTYAGRRLDSALAGLCPQYSRSTIQRWLRELRVWCDGEHPSQRMQVRGGEQLYLQIPIETAESWEPQSLPLELLHEDRDLLVLNKPPGLVVHPGAGNRGGTLANALLHHDPELARLPRAGLVHRLDKNTGGLLVVARNEATRLALVELLRQHHIKREYIAIVDGVMIAGGEINQPIGRHPVQRQRMAVVPGGKPALSRYAVEQRYRAHTAVVVRLETGRTHQIRVHLAHIGFPVLGDPMYGGRPRPPPRADDELHEQLRLFRRQALHARKLDFRHPQSGERMTVHCQPPPDMRHLIEALERDRQQGGDD